MALKIFLTHHSLNFMQAVNFHSLKSTLPSASFSQWLGGTLHLYQRTFLTYRGLSNLPQTYDVPKYLSYYPTSNPYLPLGHLGEYIAIANVVGAKIHIITNTTSNI